MRATSKQRLSQPKQIRVTSKTLSWAPWISAGAATVSALCTVGILALAIWAAFFSSASQTLVALLQTELVLKNKQIAAVEANLTRHAYLVVKEKIGANIQIFEILPQLPNSSYATLSHGSSGGTVELWKPYMNFIRKEVLKLEPQYQKAGEDLIEKFAAQCGAFKNVSFALPEIKRSETILGGLNNPTLIKTDEDVEAFARDLRQKGDEIERIGKEMKVAEDLLVACFQGMN